MKNDYFINGLIVVFLFGFFLGGSIMYVADFIDSQQSYTEGRLSILNTMVKIGEDSGSPCDIEIPVRVLTEMVNAGVMKWHEACKETISQ